MSRCLLRIVDMSSIAPAVARAPLISTLSSVGGKTPAHAQVFTGRGIVGNVTVVRHPDVRALFVSRGNTQFGSTITKNLFEINPFIYDNVPVVDLQIVDVPTSEGAAQSIEEGAAYLMGYDPLEGKIIALAGPMKMLGESKRNATLVGGQASQDYQDRTKAAKDLLIIGNLIRGERIKEALSLIAESQDRTFQVRLLNYLLTATQGKRSQSAVCITLSSLVKKLTAGDLVALLMNKENHKVLREYAAFSLRLHPDAESRTVLIGTLHDSENHVGLKHQSIRALNTHRHPESLDAFIEVLRNSENSCSLRIAAAGSLGKYSDAESRNALLEVLQNSENDNDLRKTAAYSLGNNLDEESRDALIAVLQNSQNDIELRKAAANSLGKHTSDAENRDALIAVLQNSENDKWLRFEAASSLGIYSDAESRAALIASLHNTENSEWLRSQIACMLREHPCKESRAALIKVLKMPDSGEELKSACQDILRFEGFLTPWQAGVARFKGLFT
jgi:HEAT repeat protein